MLGFFSLFSKEPERISPSIIEASDDFQKNLKIIKNFQELIRGMSISPAKVSFSTGCANLRLHTIPFTLSADINNPELITALNRYYNHKYFYPSQAHKYVDSVSELQKYLSDLWAESDKDLEIIEELLFRDAYHKSLRQSYPFCNYTIHGFVEDDFGVYQNDQHNYSPVSGNSIHFSHSSYITPAISPTTSSGRQKTEKNLENDFSTYSQLLLKKVNV